MVNHTGVVVAYRIRGTRRGAVRVDSRVVPERPRWSIIADVGGWRVESRDGAVVHRFERHPAAALFVGLIESGESVGDAAWMAEEQDHD